MAVTNTWTKIAETLDLQGEVQLAGAPAVEEPVAAASPCRMSTSYSRSGRPPDFAVRYRFLTVDEGGRVSAPRQHIRWDFLYHGDDPQRDGIWMIWPEFIDGTGDPLKEGPVPYEGVAHMFILDPDMRDKVHRSRLAVGIKGYFVEGEKRVAECEVTELIGLHQVARNL